LLWCSSSGHLEMVALLHKRGADPNIQDTQGYNCLHIAVQADKAMVVLFLLSTGIDVNCPDAGGHTPLMWATYRNTSMDCISVLIAWGAELNMQDDQGHTALHWAVGTGA
ncbi:ankyrin repeat protein, partial [Polychytrium aggregatum]|uniref:ankyrin repeat protein n=1 Tax=Polychytrium aggregatum TaxID=110093 RepID=UPI0022FE3D8D